MDTTSVCAIKYDDKDKSMQLFKKLDIILNNLLLKKMLKIINIQ